jgi:hypothetical protein
VSILDPTILAKRALRQILPRQTADMVQQTLGAIDYVRSPDRGACWGPFNGQSARQALFVDMMEKTRPKAIVETGTFLGVTAELLAQTGLY